MLRSARLYGVTLRIPHDFPTPSLSACRAFYWLTDSQPELAKSFARAVYRRYFVDNKPIEPFEHVIEVAAGLGIERGALTAALQDPAVKTRLKSEVDAGIGRGVFGSPFIFVDGEPFWGSDRLDQVERWLETGGW
jgi:2-hydroxychromene-2-carboxylate isomerase